MKDFLAALPSKLIITLVILAVLTWAVSFGFTFWTNRLTAQIKTTDQMSQDIVMRLKSQLIGKQEYETFIQFLYLKKLIESRKSPTVFLDHLAQVTPRGLRVTDLKVKLNQEEFELTGTVPNMLEAARVIKYFEGSPEVKNVKYKTKVDKQESKNLTLIDVTISGKLISQTTNQ